MKYRRKTIVITTPAWFSGDGVGHDVEGMAHALLTAGHRVFVYSPLYYAPTYEHWRVERQEIEALLRDPETVLIHHHSIGCELTESLLVEAQSRVKVMRYHNITPAEFFEGYNDDFVKNCREGRNVTPKIAPYFTDYSVPSFYDARDLIHAGACADNIHYLPYFHKLSDFDRTLPDQDVAIALQSDSRFKLLFVGRRVPNKGHLHLIRTIASYVQKYGRDIVMHIVGSFDPALSRYDQEIRSEITKYGVEDNIALHDKTSFPALVAFYKGSDLFLCMSEHEGFCIPIIEAEYNRLPVLAYYRRGVPEALGPTQPWFASLNYDEFARKIHELRIDPALRQQLADAANDSVRKRFDIDAIRSRFLNWVAAIFPHEKNIHPVNGKKRLAFVVQRYGTDVSGGAEAFARIYAERLASHYDITVITTTAKTLDWDSEIPINRNDSDGVTILRFPPKKMRDWNQCTRACEDASLGKIGYKEYLIAAGPDCPEMKEYLERNFDEYDLIVNWTYLYSNAGYVSELAGMVPIICVPFFHDEPMFHIPTHSDVANKYDGFVFQTQAERELSLKIPGLDKKPFVITGVGVDEKIVDEIRAAATTSPLSSPYLLYVGRIEPAKNVELLFDWFLRYKASNRSDLKLVMIGRVHGCELTDHEDIILPGFVSEREKYRYIKHCAALVNPSEFESFSLVLIESWAMGRPVVVNGRCAATSEQVARSGGGFIFNNYREFSYILKTIESDADLLTALGNNGNQFYARFYRWEKLIPRFKAFLDSFMTISRDDAHQAG